MMQLLSSSCNHELLAPLRCVIQMASNLISQVQIPDQAFQLRVIFNTSSMLLNQVQANLDYGLLDQNQLVANLTEN